MPQTTTNLGKVLIVPKGDHNPNTLYERLDTVQSNGSTFICLQDTTAGILIANTSYWMPFAKSAYQNWLDAGNTGTYQDFLTWIQVPAEEERQAAEQARDLSQAWASNPENQPVSGSLYSSRHYMEKALDAQSAAEQAKTSAETAWDNFDDTYLGAKASDPTLDNDGNALKVGAMYFNSVSKIFKVWDGSAWVTHPALESTRSQSTTKAPTSKLMDDELSRKANKTDLSDIFYIAGEKIPITTTANTYINEKGIVSSIAGYNTSDFKKVNNIRTAKLIGNFNQACYVVFFDKDKKTIGYFTEAGVGILERTVTFPVNAYYFRFTSTIATNSITAITVDDSYTEIAEAYISLTGSDTTGAGTLALPFKTINKALAFVGGKGTVIMKAGDYVNEPIDLTLIGNSIIKGEVGTRLIHGTRITEATLESGYTKVYKASGVVVNSYDYELWQHDIIDQSTVITVDERHTIHGNKTHRLTSTRIIKVESIQAVEDAVGLAYYVNGTDLYFSKATGSDLAVNPVIIPVWNYILTDKAIRLERIEFLYKPLILSNCTGYLKNCKVAFNNYTNIRPQTTTKMTFENVETCGSHEDGFGYIGSSECEEINCWAHSNLDEGSSLHDKTKIRRIGGLYEKNISGVADVGSSQSYLENVISRYNGANGSYVFTYYPQPDLTDNGNSVLINCIGDGAYTTSVTGGGASGKRTKCYNCIGAVGSSTIEAL